MAVEHHLLRRVQLPDPPDEFTQRNQLGPWEVADLVLVRLAGIDDPDRPLLGQEGLEVFR